MPLRPDYGHSACLAIGPSPVPSSLISLSQPLIRVFDKGETDRSQADPPLFLPSRKDLVHIGLVLPFEQDQELDQRCPRMDSIMDHMPRAIVLGDVRRFQPVRPTTVPQVSSEMFTLGKL